MFTENISLVEQINRILQKQENQEAEIISLKTQIETLTKELTLCKSKENERDILFSQIHHKLKNLWSTYSDINSGANKVIKIHGDDSFEHTIQEYVNNYFQKYNKLFMFCERYSICSFTHCEQFVICKGIVIKGNNIEKILSSQKSYQFNASLFLDKVIIRRNITNSEYWTQTVTGVLQCVDALIMPTLERETELEYDIRVLKHIETIVNRAYNEIKQKKRIHDMLAGKRSIHNSNNKTRNEKNTKAETDDDESIEVEHIIIQRKSYYIDRKTNCLYDTNNSELVGEYDEKYNMINYVEEN